jgi:hypothetical protein
VHINKLAAPGVLCLLNTTLFAIARKEPKVTNFDELVSKEVTSALMISAAWSGFGAP